MLGLLSIACSAASPASPTGVAGNVTLPKLAGDSKESAAGTMHEGAMGAIRSIRSAIDHSQAIVEGRIKTSDKSQ